MKTGKTGMIAILVMVMLTAGLAAQTAADFTYALNAASDGVVITGYKGTATRVTIPATIEDMPVKEIGPFAFCAYNINAQSITSPGYNKKGTLTTSAYTVNILWDEAILKNADVIYKITSVVIPEGVTKIGTAAFAETSIKKTSLGPSATTVTHALASITIPSTVTEIGVNAFTGCEKLTAITLPSSLKTLGIGIFDGCKGLKTISIPEGVTIIPAGTFAGCTALSSITFPKSLSGIEEGAFRGCTSLASITIPDTVTAMGKEVFGSSGVTSVTWPTKFTVIPAGTFKGAKLKTIVIPEGFTTIDPEAFRDCKDLTSVTLPSTIQIIGEGAFNGCAALTTLIIPDPVEMFAYDNSSFSGCKLSLASQAALKKRVFTVKGRVEKLPGDATVGVMRAKVDEIINLCETYPFQLQRYKNQVERVKGSWYDPTGRWYKDPNEKGPYGELDEINRIIDSMP
jgi:hypothetical protein